MASAGANAATYVYVSNAEDGNIGVYTMENDGTLRPGDRVEAGKVVMPMSVSPDKRYLYATVRTKPYTVVTYAIDRKTGALKQLSKAPLADSFPFICVDKTGRYLLGASYSGHKVSVNAIGKNGKVSDPRQVIRVQRIMGSRWAGEHGNCGLAGRPPEISTEPRSIHNGPFKKRA